MKKLKTNPASIVLLLLCLAPSLHAEDWTDWRGPRRDGVSAETNLPSRWSASGENLLWKAPYGSRSAPVVFGDRLYLLNPVGQGETVQERVLCLNADTGKVIWEHRFNVFHTDVPAHRVAWASPVVDPATGNVYVGLNQSIWAEQVKTFSISHQVITYDLLGHGRSAEVSENAVLADWVHQLEKLVEELKLERFSLVGFSFGGMIAQGFAAKHAVKIEKLVLMSTVYARNIEERAGVQARLDVATREGPQAIIGAALTRWFSPEFATEFPVVMLGYERMLRANDATSFLAAYISQRATPFRSPKPTLRWTTSPVVAIG